MDLQCTVQNYHWGKSGKDSEVAQLASLNSSMVIDESKPYAELWMGTHVSGPSHVIDTDEPLPVWLKRNLDSLGIDAKKQFGNDIPFLFKVLSVNTALSIQAHPNKEHAEKLHAERPDLYKDPNHKPELAIALTTFEALCAFRNITEIRSFVKLLPELQKILGDSLSKAIIEDRDEQAALKNAFKQLTLCDASKVAENLNAALTRLANESESNQNRVLYPLLKRLANAYPGDRGCWCIYFMNYITMKPGEAIYLGANVPHAYIHGDCIECMSCSDNVVRAGLTPKFIDASTLVDMLIYESKPLDDILFDPIVEDQFTKIWRPPVKDFAVAKIHIPAGTAAEYNTILRPTVSIILFISGKATAEDSAEKNVSRGSVLYLKACRQLTIKLDAECKDDLVAYQATCNF